MTDEAKALVALFTKFLGEWDKSRQYGEVIYGLHTGTEREVELTSTSIREARDLIETQAREIERLREELMQIEVDAMEYYNDWMEHGCEQVQATRFAFDLGQYARAALAGDSHEQ